MTSISVVDISKVSLEHSHPSDNDFKEVSETISKNFEEIGFMYIINHGISEQIITDAMEASMAFFKLEESIKNKTSKGSEYQGWVEQGREIFDQDEDGKIAELEIRETYDMKNVSDSGIFPDEVQKNISTKMKFSGFFLKSGLSTTKKNVDKVDHQQ